MCPEANHPKSASPPFILATAISRNRFTDPSIFEPDSLC